MKSEQTPKVVVGLDNMQRTPDLEEKLNFIFADAFNTPAGKAVLQALRSITIEAIAGGEITDHALRHLEGQRYLYGLIQRRINKGLSQKIVKDRKDK